MPIDRFFIGVGFLLLTVTPLAAGAYGIRSRFLPSWHGAPARVAEFVLALGMLTAIGEALGVVGAFGRWPVVLLCAAAGTGVFLATRGTESAARRGSPPTVDAIVAAIAAAVVVTQWLAVSVAALRNGMNRSIDTLWYHGPTAARFAQEGSITAPHYFDNPIFAFYPSHSELWHAFGILLFGDDVLSPVVNLAFLALALASAWAIGERFDAGPASLLGALVILGVPGFIGQPGSGYNDIIVVALLLSSVALLLRGDGRGFAVILAAIAAGMAIGVKFSAVAPVGVLSLAVVILAGRGHRLRVALTWSAVLAVTGGVWYVRNLVVAGSPVPVLEFSVGPLSLPSVPSGFTDYIAHYLTTWSIVREVFIPGLDKTLGPVWWVILLSAIGGGALVAVRGGHALWRMVGGLAVFAFVAYLFTPVNLGFRNLPIYFTPSVRYAVPALALGLVMLPALPLLQRGAGRRALVVGLAAVFLVTQLDWRALWPKPITDELVACLMIGAGAVVAVAVVRRRPWSRRAMTTVALGCVAAAAGSAWFVQRDYLENRYTEGVGSLPAVEALKARRDARIATDGFVFQYPLYGPDLSNHVQYLGELRSRGEYNTYVTSCRAWKQAINRGRYDYLLVASPDYQVGEFGGPPVAPIKLDWARSEPRLREIARDGIEAAAFEVTGRLDVNACP